MHTPDLFDHTPPENQPGTQGPAPELQSTSSLLTLLAAWHEQGWLRALDLSWVAFLHEQLPDADPLALLLAALASHQTGRGHVCLDLAVTLAQPERALSLPPDPLAGDDLPTTPEQLLASVTLEQCLDRLADLPALVSLDERSSQAADRDAQAEDLPDCPPLVLRQSTEGPLLYLRRYWQFETGIEQALRQRLSKPLTLPDSTVEQALTVLFPASDELADKGVEQPDWQRVACALAARQRFAIITGGPGTGKTTTVVKLLAMLQSLALTETDDSPPQRPLRIALTAPTGKAAARLNESIAGRVEELPLDGLRNDEQIRAHIPTEVKTLHRLLGVRAGSRHFRHHAGNPLHLDLVVVDEASMVDVELMARLLDALSPATRIILLGDKDQLASVEAGAVLGNLCQRAEAAHYTPDTVTWLQTVASQTVPAALIDSAGQPLDQATTMLRQSHRFSADSGIGQLAEAVNRGDAVRTTALLDGDKLTDLARQSAQSGLDHWLTECYRHYLEVLINSDPGDSDNPAHYDYWASQVLFAHNHFQLLCALRQGPHGVNAMNERITRALDRANLVQADHDWYVGRPVLVTQNDYNLQLMNGDIGMTLVFPVRDDQGAVHRRLRVAFPMGDGSDGIRWVMPSRLPEVETVFAMTVHKSQGSEFHHAALMLPEHDNPGLTRELVYTGITRARAQFTLVDSHPAVFKQAIRTRVQRVSGLRL